MTAVGEKALGFGACDDKTAKKKGDLEEAYM